MTESGIGPDTGREADPERRPEQRGATTAASQADGYQDPVLFDVVEGVGRIRLNLRRTINALTQSMIDAIASRLADWRDDDQITGIELSGLGERGYCSGADVRALRQNIADGEMALALHFLRTEYALDALISRYPKPFTAYLHGISMGGGLGLALHCPRRIAAADLRIGMPEVGIGIWPDVGVCFELARMPARTGWLMALTGDPVDAASALWAGLVDRVQDADPDVAGSVLAKAAPWTAECLGQATVVDALDALAGHPEPAARAAAARIRTRSPLSVAVTWEAMRRAGELPRVGDVLRQDLQLAESFFPQSDFMEGVRAQLVDKDRSPRWQHARVEDVDPALVRAAFTAGSR